MKRHLPRIEQYTPTGGILPGVHASDDVPADCSARCGRAAVSTTSAGV
ncbi:hypothetical protein ACIO3R_28070 [Streptomyces sp. NPDC087428]